MSYLITFSFLCVACFNLNGNCIHVEHSIVGVVVISHWILKSIRSISIAFRYYHIGLDWIGLDQLYPNSTILGKWLYYWNTFIFKNIIKRYLVAQVSYLITFLCPACFNLNWNCIHVVHNVILSLVSSLRSQSILRLPCPSHCF